MHKTKRDTEQPAGGPLENPRMEAIPNDPLLDPHPAEPGVTPDGWAAPLENPGAAPARRGRS